MSGDYVGGGGKAINLSPAMQMMADRRLRTEALRARVRDVVLAIPVYNFPLPFWVTFRIMAEWEVVCVIIAARGEGRDFEITVDVNAAMFDTVAPGYAVRRQVEDALRMLAIGIVFNPRPE